MYCTNCGKQIKDGLKFCTGCGKAMGDKKVDTPKQKVEEPSQTSKPNIKNTLEKDFIKLKLNLKQLVIGIVAIIVLIIFIIVISSNHGNSKITSVTNNNTQSVVDIWCDNNQGGSGTIFTTDGTVLTNNHVITGATLCQVTIPNPLTGGIAEIYDATPVITPILSKKYDIATVKIDGSYTDSNGKTWGIYPTTFSPFILPSTCNTKTSSQLGDSVRIYGYPTTSGGYNLTITDGVISSFADDGNILTSAKVDSGNSGGLAVDQNGCWLGIPSAVISGNYQNLGVIIPGNVVEKFLVNVPVKVDPATNNTNSLSESALTPSETPDQECQSEYGTDSQSSGSTDSKGNPTCICQSGYSWDATGNSCALQTSLQSECVNNYGVGSYSYQQSGKAMCDCSTGYQMNSDQTACVVQQAETGYQVCADMNATWDGSSHASDGSYSCTCDTGYVSGSDGKSCVVAPALTNTQICASSLPNSYWNGGYNSGGGPTCSCSTGYYWDNNTSGKGSGCYTTASLNQECSTQYTNSSWDGKYGTNGVYECGCQAGYQWNSSQTACVVTPVETGYQSCIDNIPNSTWDGYSYTSSGGYSCTCDTGYTSEGNSCIYSGY